MSSGRRKCGLVFGVVGPSPLWDLCFGGSLASPASSCVDTVAGCVQDQSRSFHWSLKDAMTMSFQCLQVTGHTQVCKGDRQAAGPEVLIYDPGQCCRVAASGSGWGLST